MCESAVPFGRPESCLVYTQPPLAARVVTGRPSDYDPLDLIEAYVIPPPVVKLDRRVRQESY